MGWLDTLIEVAVPAAGALLGASANRSAAKTASAGAERAAQIEAEAQEKARQEFRAAAERGIGAIREGTAGYQQTIAPLLRSPDMLTPAQEIAREDLHREMNAQLAASGLRGAGRSGVAAFFDADRRFLADAMDRNQDRSDQARRGLAGIFADQGRSIANTEIGAGSQLGSSFQSEGRAGAGAANDAAAYQAQAGLANARLYGSAIGSIGSLIADERKRQATEARSVGGLYG